MHSTETTYAEKERLRFAVLVGITAKVVCFLINNQSFRHVAHKGLLSLTEIGKGQGTVLTV